MRGHSPPILKASPQAAAWPTRPSLAIPGVVAVRGNLAAARLLAGLVGVSFVVRVVLGWLRALDPPRTVLDIVTQDEYTHDVIVPWDERLVLVFDAT